MFAARFFTESYFPRRYFPAIGAAVIEEPSPYVRVGDTAAASTVRSGAEAGTWKRSGDYAPASAVRE